MKPYGDGADAPPELSELQISACARIARKHRDQIHIAMRDGLLAHHRDSSGKRVAKLDDLIAWMRSQNSKVSA